MIRNKKQVKGKEKIAREEGGSDVERESCHTEEKSMSREHTPEDQHKLTEQKVIITHTQPGSFAAVYFCFETLLL